MPGFIGRLIDVGIGVEDPRGTQATPTYWIDKMTATVDDKPEVVIDESSVSRIEDSIGGKVVKEGAEGEISGKVLDQSFGAILLAAIGKVSSALKGGETIVYEHTYEVLNESQHPSLTIEVKSPVEQLAFVLAMLESLEIRAEVGKYAEYTATFKSKTGIVSTTSPAYVCENDFITKYIEVKLADNLAGLPGASAIPVRSITLTITKNLERDDTFGSNDPNDILNKQFSIEASIVLLHTDTTYKTIFKAGTYQAMRIDMKNTDITIGTGSNPELMIDLAQVIFSAWEKSTGNNDLVIETITAKATYSKDDSQMIGAVLTNEAIGY